MCNALIPTQRSTTDILLHALLTPREMIVLLLTRFLYYFIVMAILLGIPIQQSDRLFMNYKTSMGDLNQFWMNVNFPFAMYSP